MAKRINRRLWVGCKGMGEREVFRCAEKPTETSHGGQYRYCIGPFRTRAGANWMADPIRGTMNPHCQTVHAAEKLARKYGNPLVKQHQ